MRERIRELERRVKEGANGGNLEERFKNLERKIEKEERQARRKNLIFKRIRGEKEKLKENGKDICKGIGAEVMIEKVREIRAGNEERGKMVLVKLESEEERKKILENKRKLKGKEIRIEEDLTFRERKMKWRLRQIAEDEK